MVNLITHALHSRLAGQLALTVVVGRQLASAFLCQKWWRRALRSERALVRYVQAARRAKAALPSRTIVAPQFHSPRADRLPRFKSETKMSQSPAWSIQGGKLRPFTEL